MKKRTLASYTTEEKVAFFDNFYKKASSYFEGYVEKIVDYDDEMWNMRDELMDVLTDVVYPGEKERPVYRWLDMKVENQEEVPTKKDEGFRIAWYRHGWEEEMDIAHVKELKGLVGGAELVFEIAPSNEGAEYAICSQEMDERMAEALRDAVLLLEKQKPALLQNCYSQQVLQLRDEKDIQDFLAQASQEIIQVYGSSGKERVSVSVPIYLSRETQEEVSIESYDRDTLEDIFGEKEEVVMQETDECPRLDNRVDCPWYLKNEEDMYYDFVLNQFIKERTATAALPLYEIGQSMIGQLCLKNVVIKQEYAANAML